MRCSSVAYGEKSGRRKAQAQPNVARSGRKPDYFAAIVIGNLAFADLPALPVTVMANE